MINTVQSWLEQCPEEDRPAALAALGVIAAAGNRYPLEEFIRDHFYPRRLPWRLDENLPWALEAYSANRAARLWGMLFRHWPEQWLRHREFLPLVVQQNSWRDAGLDPISLSQVLAAAMGGVSPLIEIPGGVTGGDHRLRPLVLDGMAELKSYRSQRQDYPSDHLIVAADPREARFLLDGRVHAHLISIIDASAEAIERMISDLFDEYGSHHLHADIICNRLGVLPPIHLASSGYVYYLEERHHFWDGDVAYWLWREYGSSRRFPSDKANRRASEFLATLFVGSMERRFDGGSPRYDSLPVTESSDFIDKSTLWRFSLGTDDVEMPRAEASPFRARRWLNGQVRDRRGRMAPQNACFRRGFACSVDVWIGLSPPVGQKDAPSFPDDRLPRDEAVHDLRVVLTEPRLLPHPIEVPFRLPATGASERVSLPLPKMEGKRFEGRILVCHGNRILQTAKLTGAIRDKFISRTDFIACDPEDAIRFEIEAVLDGELAELNTRPGFDAAILVNDSFDGTSQATVLTGGSASIFSYDDKIKGVLRTIQMSLDELVEADFTGNLVGSPPELWRLLAHQGDALLRDVVEAQMEGVATAQRLQIVAARPDAFLPLEFVYDAETLPQTGAGLCPYAASAFSGACRATCTPDKLRQGFCPLRFWSFSKIIERHVYDPRSRPGQGDFRVETASPGGRKNFPPVKAAILGAYDGIKTVPAGVAALETLRTTPPTPHDVSNWNDWKAVLKTAKPQVLILLSHTYLDEDTRTAGLTIGAAEELVIGDINADYVAVDERTPLVLLLGCSTSNPNQSGQEFHAQFRRRGATIVVGTLAKTYGPLAADAAGEFLRLLTDPDRPTTLGEMMVEIRRRLLLRGSLMALALVAYGDADWIMREEA
jgi:hypothetical protein